MTKILIIDDESAICRAFSALIEGEGHAPLVAATVARGLEAFRRDEPDLVFLDVRLPDGDGVTALRAMKALRPETPVVVITAHGGLETAVRAMQAGAFDYLVKPVDIAQARALIGRALAGKNTAAAAPRVTPPGAPAPLLVGRSAAIQEVFKRIGAVASSDVHVLIQGESGTGKELVARALHAASARHAGPFEPIDCAALPADLVESELYGHERGAFTGAVRDNIGRFRRAHGGTLFLDEIGELPLPAQAKLLRFLAEREVMAVGGSTRVAVDVRIVAATNRPLERAVETGAFREDLFYRLNVVAIHVPPLRDRREDIAALVESFVARSGSARPAVSAEALAILERYDWPGNVRELRNAVEHAVALARGPLMLPDHLPAYVRATAIAPRPETPAPGASPAADALESVAATLLDEALAAGLPPHAEAIRRLEAALLAEALRRSKGSRSAAARLLKLNRATLRKRLREGEE